METWGRIQNLLSLGTLIWQVFLYPAEGLHRAARQQPVGWAIALTAGVTFVYSLVSWTDRTVYTVIVLVLLLISSAALQRISWLLGGQGSYAETLSALGFASVPPGIVGIILTLLTKDMGDWGETLKTVSDIGLFLWGLGLIVIAVREAHGLSTLQAVGACAAFVGIIIGLTLLWTIVPLLALVGALMTFMTIVLWPTASRRR